MTRPSNLIRELDAHRLAAFVGDGIDSLSEEEVLAVLANHFCSTQICQLIGQSARLTSLYSVRRRLVSHRATPLTQALKFVHYLYWNDLLRLSTDVRIPAIVRRAIDLQLINKQSKLSLGEKLATARSCSREVASALFNDPTARVIRVMLDNPRLTEDDVIRAMACEAMTTEKLGVIADHRRWSQRLAIRRALALHPKTPPAVAASQLRHLSRQDRAKMLQNPGVSLFLKRCIERLGEEQNQQFARDGEELQ